MKIRCVELGDAERLSVYYAVNKEHFRAWEPKRAREFYTLSYWQDRVYEMLAEQNKGEAAYFLLVESGESEIVAHCTLSQIVRGVFQACYMGYGISAHSQGKGLMPQLCRTVIAHGFSELGLHRIMANYMPHNNRSAQLLNQLGFRREGYAKDYLKINGHWEDHVMMALVRKV